ncbi:MAG: MBL fold metallo-hydrolase [Bacteroidia bacterium]|nr:MBL fold metallo-hydrolase [Bacteroidia bacterium]
MLKVEKFTFNPFLENTYLLYEDRGDCAIIDPGCSNEKERKVLEDFIRARGLNPTVFLNTHCHIDHVFGNAWVARRYKLGLQMHEEDLPVLHSTVQYGLGFGLAVEKSPEPQNFLNEGDIVKVGASKLKVIFTPGHSPGSVCFINEDEKYVIAGDVLFQLSIGRTDLPGGDHDTLIKSIKTKMFALPDDFEVHPGHGPSTNIGFEKKNNPFLS